MPRPIQVRPIFAIENPNKAWVVKELDILRKEWDDWKLFADALGDSPEYDPQTCTEVIKDGWANISKHEILREKTLVFIGNNFSGYDFIFANWPSHPHEDNTSRLRTKIPAWIHRLETLSACAEYARVPDGFWKSKGKELVEKIIEVGPEKGAELASSWLKNPLRG
jgi:hypothetical protein